ncbi:MAG: lipopolysaccharide biosynthesis protein [Armatimonadetes bacterium]|nr:lipopolysaccharide biosynthesis protein [Armatimonadota bacterium]
MGWTLLSAMSVRVLQLLVTIVLARILVPAEFGLFALAMMIVTAIGIFRDVGLGQALIYHKTDVQKNAETTLLMSAAFGVVAWSTVYAAAPLVASIFGNTELTWPLRIMSGSVVISSLATVPSILLERELEFRKRAIPEFAMGISYAVVSVALALTGYGIWSLVVGHLASITVSTTVTWLVAGWRPVAAFHSESARRTLRFGKPLMAASVIVFAFFYVDQAAIGKWLGVTELGYYTLAFTICNLPATNITHVVSKVMYPAYARLNDNIPEMRAAYLQTVNSIALLSFPIAVYLCFAAGDFVTGFFGQKWLPAIPLFRALALYGLLRSIGATAGSIFMAVGEPKWVYRLNFVQLAVVLPLVYPVAIKFGALGVAVLFTLAYTTGTSLALWKVTKILEMSAWDYVTVLRGPLISSVAAVGIAYLASALVLPAGIATAVVSGVLAAAGYLAIALRLDGETFEMVRSVLFPVSAEQVCESASQGKESAEPAVAN